MKLFSNLIATLFGIVYCAIVMICIIISIVISTIMMILGIIGTIVILPIKILDSEFDEERMKEKFEDWKKHLNARVHLWDYFGINR